MMADKEAADLAMASKMAICRNGDWRLHAEAAWPPEGCVEYWVTTFSGDDIARLGDAETANASRRALTVSDYRAGWL